MTKQLLAFARRQIIAPQVIDLNALVLETSGLLQRVLPVEIAMMALPIMFALATWLWWPRKHEAL